MSLYNAGMQLSALSPLDPISPRDRRTDKKSVSLIRRRGAGRGSPSALDARTSRPSIFREFFAEAPRGQYFRGGWKILIPFGGTLRGTPGRLCYTAGSDPTVPPRLTPRVQPATPNYVPRASLRAPTPVPARPPATPRHAAPRRAAPRRHTAAAVADVPSSQPS